MAVDEIITANGQEMEMSFSRGNVGVLLDAVFKALNVFEIPAVVGGGGGGEHSYTF
jgi:hypothetical protein